MPRKRSKRKPAERPASDFDTWKGRAAAELASRYDVTPATIPHHVWRDLFIRNMTPEQAAEQANVSAYNVRRSSELLRGKASR